MEEDFETRKKRKQGKLSVVVTFVIAILSVLSLTIYGIVSNQDTGISYAADDEFTGNSFVLQTEDYYISISDMDTARVPVFFAQQGSDKISPVFCVEHSIPYPSNDGNVEYLKDGNIPDYGLLYLLDASFTVPDDECKTATDCASTSSSDVAKWITQTAIWSYLKKENPSATEHDYTPPTNVTNLKKYEFNNAVITGTTDVYRNGPALIGDLSDTDNSVVGKLVREARAIAKDMRDHPGDPILTISDFDLKLASDEKSYISSEISVSVVNRVAAPKSLQSYKISVDGIEGAVVVDANGEEFANSELPVNTKFFVKIPVESITNEEQELNVTVTGTFDMLMGHYYVASGATPQQKVISVTGDTRSVSAVQSVPVAGVPDTGMNTAQTIYFVGLIVLLCGVGIIYANAKPIENKQQ